MSPRSSGSAHLGEGSAQHLHFGELTNVLRKVPPAAWAGALATFDKQAFGPDAWPRGAWKHELSSPFSSYIAYVIGGEAGEKTDAVSAPSAINARNSIPEIVAIGGISLGYEPEIVTIAVAREHRRRGIGAQLLADLITLAEREPATSLFLEVRSHDQATQDLYLRHGFTAVGFRRNYYKDDDAVVMRRDLGSAESQ